MNKSFKRFLALTLVVLLAGLIIGIKPSFATTSTTQIIGEPPPAVTALDLDINNDGVVNQTDISQFDGAYGSQVGDSNYIRKFDINCDGVINDYDENYVENSNNIGLNLAQIRKNLLTGGEQTLTWANPNVSAELRTVTSDEVKVQAFTGYSLSDKPLTVGWLHGVYHQYVTCPNSQSYCYVCLNFGTDLALASYKTIGAGAIMLADSDIHGYDIFYTGDKNGGGWQNLANWNIIEPQDGAIWQASNVPDTTYNGQYIYHTQRINFFYGSPYDIGDYRYIDCATLNVDYTNKTVEYDNTGSHGVNIGSNGIYPQEEKIPMDYTFNTSLGIFTLPVTNDWDLISVPFHIKAADLGVGDVLWWDGNFWVTVTDLYRGEAYLLDSSVAKDVTMAGTTISYPYSKSITANTDTLFGVPYTSSCRLIFHNIRISSATSSNSDITYLMYWDGNVWEDADPNNLQPGVGYLIKTDVDGAITLTLNP